MAAIAYPLPHDRRLPARPRLRLVPGGRRAAPSAATYARRRLVAAVVVVLLAVALAGAVSVAGGVAGAWLSPPASASVPASGGGGDASSPAVYVVQPGDTAWELARRFGGGGDVRARSDALQQAAGADGLQVGERLVVP